MKIIGDGTGRRRFRIFRGIRQETTNGKDEADTRHTTHYKNNPDPISLVSNRGKKQVATVPHWCLTSHYRLFGAVSMSIISLNAIQHMISMSRYQPKQHI